MEEGRGNGIFYSLWHSTHTITYISGGKLRKRSGSVSCFAERAPTCLPCLWGHAGAFALRLQVQQRRGAELL